MLQLQSQLAPLETRSRAVELIEIGLGHRAGNVEALNVLQQKRVHLLHGALDHGLSRKALCLLVVGDVWLRQKLVAAVDLGQVGFDAQGLKLQALGLSLHLLLFNLARDVVL